MTNHRVTPLIVLLLLTTGAVNAQPASDYLRSNPRFVQSFREAVQPHAASIVRVQCDGKDTCLGTIVGADGWVLAKAHDLTGKIVCKLHDGREFEAQLVGIYEPHDLAMLRITATGLHVVAFSDSKHVKAGSWVASVGAGMDAAAIGVVSVATRKVHEAYLGVLMDTTPQGLVVKGVGEKTAAFKAGLQAKDILLHANGQRIADADQFQQIIGELKPGDTLALKVKRGNMEQEIKAVLQSREQANDFRSEFQNRLGSDLSTRRSGYTMILQHDSVVKPGDCGGPLVDLHGRVIGINISRAGRVESWAIPAEVVQPLIAELKSGRLAPREKKAD